MSTGRFCAIVAAAGVVTPALTAMAAPTDVVILVENIAPQMGTHFTPVWMGFHNGQFDVFSPGSPASVALERIAEDGDASQLMADFTASGFGGIQQVLSGPGDPPVFFPGQMNSLAVGLESTDPSNRYLSFASMVVPSNDAFIGNPDPQAIPVFDDAGNLIPRTIVILGSQVWDAGTEVNDEIPAHTAFFGQTTPNTGTTEGGVVHLHPGFLGSVSNPGTAMILADPQFVNADFKLSGYEVARITIVPEPTALAGFLLGSSALLLRTRRR